MPRCFRVIPRPAMELATNPRRNMVEEPLVSAVSNPVLPPFMKVIYPEDTKNESL